MHLTPTKRPEEYSPLPLTDFDFPCAFFSATMVVEDLCDE
jgi:hypothetical protein